MTEHTYQALTLTTQDETSLTARYYANTSQVQSQAILLIAGATGVAQHFYRHYAQAANKQGFEVLTFDYRGIGDSAPASLKGYKMRYLDWAFQDLNAAIAFVDKQQNSQGTVLPIFIIGHSFGGHALGLVPNVEKVQGAYLFGAGAGWHGWMPRPERYKVWFMWNVLAPVLVKIKGYMAWSLLGMGEDLPHGVYKDWKHWCRYPHYFFDDPDMNHLAAIYARCNTPIVAANASDDLWAQPVSRDAFIHAYSNATVTKQTLVPAEMGLKAIDHMGYFKPNAQAIWQLTFDWFKQQNMTEHKSN